MTRRIPALALALILVLALSSFALGETVPQDTDTLVVGTLTPMSGHFFTDMWGNNTSDIDVRSMIEGYDTVVWTANGNFQIDSNVVVDYLVADNAAGNREYTLTLNPALCYSDGTPITAKDYVFDALLRASPLIANLGGTNAAMGHLVGFEGYQSGKPLSGVRLISDSKFSVTISKQFLPYFYELEMIHFRPTPIGIIAPGCEVVDNGAGAYVEPVKKGARFNAASLRKTLLDPEKGYVSHPSVSSGPYTLDTYDAAGQQATFSINTQYAGNFEGQKPAIPHVVFKLVDAASMFDELKSGRIGLINKVANADQISAGLALRKEQIVQGMNYPRTGMNMLAFACELGPTQSQYVRRAVAFSIDAQALCDQYLQVYGLPVFGYYGLGQKMTQDQSMLDSLARYFPNTNAAVNELTTDGWIYNEQGELFQPGQDAVRHQKNGEKLIPLALRCALPETGGLTPLMESQLTENLATVGIKLTIEKLPYTDLLRQYYRQDVRQYNMMQLATNFQKIFDPYYTFHVEDAYQGLYNTTGIRDKALMDAADAMRRSEPNDEEGYMQKWLRFQACFNEVLPMVPLYSNVYFDFYRNDLHEYPINAQYGWGPAVLYAYIGEPKPANSSADGVPEGGK